MIADEVDALQRVLTLGNERRPILGVGLANVDGDHLAKRSVLAGEHREDRAIVSDETVVVVVIRNQFDGQAIRFRESL